MHTNNLTLGSLFDGIGGFPYAASFYGIRSLWASEIVPECVSVTRRHFPDMAHMGDITQLHGGRLPPVDIITFGSPCQGLSVAGQRRGLADERSGLFTEAIRIIDEMRKETHGKYPQFAIFENVPGALSSSGRRDFKVVLEAFTKSEVSMPRSGRWANAGMVRGREVDLAWVMYDAQYFATAQRRRRLFLVCDFRGTSAGEILFVPKSLRGYFEAGGTPRQGLTAFTESGADTAGPAVKIVSDYGIPPITAPTIFVGINGSLAGPLDASYYKGTGSRCGKERDVVLCIATGQSYWEYTVRRLTPLEAERLMGYDDFWTAYGHDGRPVSDTKRYQMLGNSIVVPCVAYIMQGIRDVMDRR